MRLFVLGSGSTGNAMLVEASGTRSGLPVRILVEAGIGPKRVAQRMAELGGDLFPLGVDAIVVTHEHADHAAHIEPLCKALRVPERSDVSSEGPMLLLHSRTELPRIRERWRVTTYTTRQPFHVRGVEIRALPVPHDAPHVALSFHTPTHALGVVTDVGSIPKALPPFLGACDTVMLEANYCPMLLGDSEYPDRIKRRIASDAGHLSNDQAAAVARALRGTRVSTLLLCHISANSNTPERALEAVRAARSDLDVRAIPHGVARRFDLQTSSRHFVQLPLF